MRPSPVERVMNKHVSQSEVDEDVQLQRIVTAWQVIRHNGYAPVTYHGKMRAADVSELEEYRLRHAERAVVQGVRVHPL